MGVNLSETPIPFEDGVTRKRLGRLVHACPVDSPVGNNPLSLTLNKLKRADSGNPLLVVGEEGVVVVGNSSHVTLCLQTSRCFLELDLCHSLIGSCLTGIEQVVKGGVVVVVKTKNVTDV